MILLFSSCFMFGNCEPYFKNKNRGWKTFVCFSASPITGPSSFRSSILYIIHMYLCIHLLNKSTSIYNIVRPTDRIIFIINFIPSRH